MTTRAYWHGRWEDGTGIRGSGPGLGGSGGQQATLTKDKTGSLFLLHFQVQAGKETIFDMRTVVLRQVYVLQWGIDVWDNDQRSA